MNAYFDMPVNNLVVPYVGAGLGYGHISEQFNYINQTNGTIHYRGQDNFLLYQLIACVVMTH